MLTMEFSSFDTTFFECILLRIISFKIDLILFILI